MALGDGKAKKEAQDLKQELAFMYDAITSLGDKLIDSFEQAVDEAGNMNNAFEIASKTFQRGLAADLKQSVKNTDALIDLYAKLGRDAITQKDIAKEQEKIDSNRLRLQIKRKALGNSITNKQKEFFTLQESELDKQQKTLNTINTKNDLLQKQKGFFQIISENAGGLADKLDKSGTLSKILQGNILKTLTPLRLFEIVVLGIFNAFKGLDKTTKDVAQQLGVSYHEAQGMNKEFSQIAQDSNSIFVTTQGVAKSQIELSKILGTNAMFTAEMLQTQTQLTHQLGLSAETSGEIAKLGLLTGQTSKEIASNVLGQSVAMNAANGTAITEKEVLKEVAKLSSAIQLSMANNPIELAKAVQTAKQFGMELSAVDGIAGSLLNFEDSISNELEAELLLGKNINLEKARQAALNNDLATVAQEVAKQAGSAADFAKMNRLQQEALAKAVGMNREDLAKSLQDQEILSKLGGKDVDTKAAYNRLVQEGYSQEQIAAKLGDKKLADALHAESIQDRFNASIKKAQELFVQLANALMPIIEPIADAVGLMASLISKSMGFLKVLGSIIAAFKVIKFLGDDVYRNELLRNTASKLGLVTEQQKVLNKGRETALAVEGVTVEKLSNFHKNQGLLTQIKNNAIEKSNLVFGKEGLAIQAKDLVMEKAKLVFGKEGLIMKTGELAIATALNIKKGIANTLSAAGAMLENLKLSALISQGAAMVKNIAKGAVFLAQQLATAAAALTTNAAATFGIGAAIAVGAALAGYAALKAITGDDVMSPGSNTSGYGSRTLLGPEGAIALNNKDTVIAGTKLFNQGNNNSPTSSGPVNVVQDNSRMEKLLERAINKPDPVIKMNGDKLGTAIGKYSYSTQ